MAFFALKIIQFAHLHLEHRQDMRAPAKRGSLSYPAQYFSILILLCFILNLSNSIWLSGPFSFYPKVQ